MGSGGKERKETNAMMAQDRAQSRAFTGQMQGLTVGGMQGAQGRANTMYDPTISTYTDIMKNGGLDPATLAKLQAGGGGGGPNPASMNESIADYREWGKGGKVEMDKMREAMGGMRSVAGDGGYSGEERGRLQGMMKGYQQNGGLDQNMENNMRSRGMGATTSMFKTGRNDMMRANAASGMGANPALMARSVRDQARAAGENTRDTEMSIFDKRDEGKRYGLESEQSMLNNIANARTGASQAWAGAETGAQDLRQKGQMFGTQGLESAKARQAQMAAAGSQARAANSLRLAQMNVGNRLDAAGGMSSLLSRAPGEVNMYMGGAMENQGMNNRSNDAMYQSRLANNPQVSAWDRAAKIGGMVAGGMTGFGALGMGGSMLGGGGGGGQRNPGMFFGGE